MKMLCLISNVLATAFLAGTSLNAADPLDSWTQTFARTAGALNGATYGGGLYVAVGEAFGGANNALRTSSDGGAWSTRSVDPELIYAVTYGSGKFVAAAEDGAIFNSIDGVAWTSLFGPVIQDLHGVAYNGSTYVAVGLARTIISSPDGVTWTARAAPSGRNLDFFGVTFGKGIFVAVGLDNDAPDIGGAVVTSPDGITWADHSLGGGSRLYGVTFHSGTFVAVGHTGSVLTSPDGVSWSSRIAPTTGASLQAVAGLAGRLVAVGQRGTIVSSDNNGVSWTARASGVTNDLLAVAAGSTNFIAAGFKQVILRSGAFPPPVSIVITQDVQSNVVAEENHTARLGPVAAAVMGAPLEQLTFQWQKNGIDIPGATNSFYITPVLVSADNGSIFRCTLSVPGASAISASGTVTVVRDRTSPQLYSVSFAGVGTSDLSSINTLKMMLLFNEYMDPITAGNIATYAFDRGTITSATLESDRQTVTLTIRGIAPPQTDYSLVLRNITDISTNMIATVTNRGIIPFYAINHALTGIASQSSVGFGAGAERAIDGSINGDFFAGSVTHNGTAEDPAWWEVDLETSKAIGRVRVWFRTDCCTGQSGVSGPPRNDDFTVSVLDSNRASIWRTTYPGRPLSDAAYNFAPTLLGRYVRVESQHPRTTSDGYFSLAEVQVLAPYTNVMVHERIATSVRFTNSVEEYHRGTLGTVSAIVNGPPQDELTFQWQKNAVDVPGATNASYITPPLALVDTGNRYRCKFILSGMYVLSREWTVAVLPDQTPPQVQSLVFDEVGTPNLLRLTVTFNEVMNLSSLLNRTHYQLAGGTIVSNLIPSLDGTSVAFWITNVDASTGKYSFTLRGLSDVKGNDIGAVPTFYGIVPFSSTNLALFGHASQSSVGFGAGPERAIDGSIDGNFWNGSVTHNGTPEQGGWWEVDLGAEKYIGRIHLWFRTDCCTNRQDNFTLKILDPTRSVVWQRTYSGRPPTDTAFNIESAVAGRVVRFEAPVPPIDDGAFSLAEVHVFSAYVAREEKIAVPVVRTVQLDATNLVLSWKGTATVERAATLGAPWTEMATARDSYRLPIPPCLNCREFFRVRFPPFAIESVFNVPITIDSIAPTSEIWVGDEVAVHFTLYNRSGQTLSGYVNGYVSRTGGWHILESDFAGATVVNLPPNGQFSGVIFLRRWQPEPIYSDGEQHVGEFDLFLQFWHEAADGRVSYNGKTYSTFGLGSFEGSPIDIYPRCGNGLWEGKYYGESSSLLDIGLFKLETFNTETGSLEAYLDPATQRIQPHSGLTLSVYCSVGLVVGYPPFKSHPGSLARATLYGPGLPRDGFELPISKYSTASGSRGIDISGIAASEFNTPYSLVVSGNCGSKTASLTFKPKPPPPIPPLPPDCTWKRAQPMVRLNYGQDGFGVFIYWYDWTNIRGHLLSVKNPNNFTVEIAGGSASNPTTDFIALPPGETTGGADLKSLFGAEQPDFPLFIYASTQLFLPEGLQLEFNYEYCE